MGPLYRSVPPSLGVVHLPPRLDGVLSTFQGNFNHFAALLSGLGRIWMLCRRLFTLGSRIASVSLLSELRF